MDMLTSYLAAHALDWTLSLLGLALVPLFAMATPKVNALIDTHVKSERLKKILKAVADAALVNVQSVAQTTVDAARKGGGVPADVAERARKAAIEGVIRDIGPAMWKALVESMGSEDAALASVGTQVEAAVRVVKTTPSGRPLVTVQ